MKVNGDDADPLFKFLKEQKGFAGWDMSHPLATVLDDMLSKEDPDYKEKADIKWNFTKFLTNKLGMVVERFEPTESIDNIAAKIEELLKNNRLRPKTVKQVYGTEYRARTLPNCWQWTGGVHCCHICRAGQPQAR